MEERGLSADKGVPWEKSTTGRQPSKTLTDTLKRHRRVRSYRVQISTDRRLDEHASKWVDGPLQEAWRLVYTGPHSWTL